LGWLGLTLCARIDLIESNPDLLRCSDAPGCEDLLLNPQLKILGLLPADLGFFYFILFLVALVLATKFAQGLILFRFLLWAGFFVALASLFLQLFVLHKVCPYCLSLDLILILITWFGTAKKPLVAEWTDFIWASLLGIQAVIAVALFSFGPDYPKHSVWVVGKVNGQNILSSEMEDRLSLALQPNDEIRYGMEKEWLEKEINQSVLRLEAQRERSTPEQLIFSHVGLPASDNDHTWQIKKAAYLNGLWAKYGAITYLTPPIPKVVHFDLKDTLFEGNPRAPFQIIVFSDYQCPFCQIMAPVLSDFYQSHPSDIAIGYWPFPLQVHKQAWLAALAAYSAAQQGRFWDYNELLYTEPVLNDATYLRLAKKINLDLVAFETCRSSSAAANYIEDHYQRASSMGINGIPTIFINGRMVGGMLTKADLEGLYQEEIKAKNK